MKTIIFLLVLTSVCFGQTISQSIFLKANLESEIPTITETIIIVAVDSANLGTPTANRQWTYSNMYLGSEIGLSGANAFKEYFYRIDQTGRRELVRFEYVPSTQKKFNPIDFQNLNAGMKLGIIGQIEP